MLALVVLRRSERRAVVVVARADTIRRPRPAPASTRAGAPRRDSAPARDAVAARLAQRGEVRAARRAGRSRATCSRRGRRGRRGSCRRSSRRRRTAAGRGRRRSCPRSIARRQCSKSVPSSADTRRQAVRPRARPPRASGALRNGTRSSRTAASPVARTYSATTCGSQSRSSEQRLRSPRPVGSCHQCCTSPFDELPARGAEQVLARQIGPREGQRHHVLQLVAEAERAAGLVVAAARPEPAAHRLIEQPAVHQRVERIVGRPHLDRVERVVPRRVHPRARGRGRVRRVRDGRSAAGRGRDRSPSPEQEDELPAFRPAAGRIEPGAPRTDRGRRRHCPESAAWPSAAGRDTSPLRPMNDRRSAVKDDGALARARERDVAGEVLVVGVASRRSRRSPGRSSVTTCRCSPSRGGPSTHSL